MSKPVVNRTEPIDVSEVKDVMSDCIHHMEQSLFARSNLKGHVPWRMSYSLKGGYS
ncbi:hypothetical protein KDA_47720 [Dictyobacter alpinus]|uniref:Uncharacterized protein n=1 Tax=Dictyobacter alpinus TaxID=2014873 RepID=A0A402BD16_9CHLR|nr:hypothetical protein KDA_47720 [Dictyobacter alpinus]